MQIYPREQYLRKIRPFYDDTGLIKVITGIRRCGKSCLMQSIATELTQRSIDAHDIVFLNLDQYGYHGITTPEALDKVIQERIPPNGTIYLFIDEIQNVHEFEPLINAYRETGRFSIFLTGSNSYLLSGELITKLTGRYIEIEMFPLTFHEYICMRDMRNEHSDIVSEFQEFLAFGGLPKALEYSDGEARSAYINDVVSQIFQKDIRSRHKVRDVEAFARVQDYMVNNYAAPTNANNIAKALSNGGRTISYRTVGRYLELLENAKILYRCPRFDLKSRRSLRGLDKFYLADLGIRYARNTDARVSFGPALENVMYLYLRAKGYEVSVGKIGSLECDFIIRRENRYAYIQVSATVSDRNVFEREMRPLEQIKDNYPKYLLTTDLLPETRNGIIHLNIMNFLAEDNAKDLTSVAG